MPLAAPAYSVVAPLHNEAGNVEALHQAIAAALQPLPGGFEILLVDDGSSDDTGPIIDRLARADRRVRPLHLARNCGQSAALSAGFAYARGQIVLTLDGDLQNDPADFPILLDALREPVRVVSGWRRNRRDGFWLRTLPSRAANWLIAAVTRLPSRDTGCCLKAYRAEVVRGARLPAGMHRFLPAVLGVRAGEFAEVEVSHHPRTWGASHYGLSRLLVVLRDLCVMPLIQRGPARRWPVITAAGTVVAVLASIGGAWLAGQDGWVSAVGLAIWISAGAASLALCCALWGLRRFLDAERHGVFELREISAPALDAAAETLAREPEYGRQTG